MFLQKLEFTECRSSSLYLPKKANNCNFRHLPSFLSVPLGHRKFLDPWGLQVNRWMKAEYYAQSCFGLRLQACSCLGKSKCTCFPPVSDHPLNASFWTLFCLFSLFCSSWSWQTAEQQQLSLSLLLCFEGMGFVVLAKSERFLDYLDSSLMEFQHVLAINQAFFQALIRHSLFHDELPCRL